MGKIHKPHPVKLIAGFIFTDDIFFSKAKLALKRQFGDMDFESEILDFNYTDYYEKEMGASLKRSFVSFRKLIQPVKLPDIKILTNKIEEKLSIDKINRVVNIDPGYLDLAKLILATTKDFNHRIYLNKGIYAETTLTYQDKKFKSFDWTYPDYRTAEYAEIFNNIRELYRKQTGHKDTRTP